MPNGKRIIGKHPCDMCGTVHRRSVGNGVKDTLVYCSYVHNDKKLCLKCIKEVGVL